MHSGLCSPALFTSSLQVCSPQSGNKKGLVRTVIKEGKSDRRHPSASKPSGTSGRFAAEAEVGGRRVEERRDDVAAIRA